MFDFKRAPYCHVLSGSDWAVAGLTLYILTKIEVKTVYNLIIFIMTEPQDASPGILFLAI